MSWVLMYVINSPQSSHKSQGPSISPNIAMSYVDFPVVWQCGHTGWEPWPSQCSWLMQAPQCFEKPELSEARPKLWPETSLHITPLTGSDVLAWLGLEATAFGLALGGFGFWNPQPKPQAPALAAL